MLRKLMKHEFRATLRLMIPLYLVTLVLAVGAWIMTELTSRIAGDGPAWDMITFIMGMTCIGAILALVVVPCMTVVLMILRFRSNLMADEGYVMFTLPVSNHQLVWSKLLVSLVWLVGAFVVDVLAMCIMSMGVDIWAGLFDLFRAITEAFAEYPGDAALLTVEILVLVVLAAFVFCLRFYAPLAIGHSFARHKLLLSVVFYFVISIATNMAAGVFLIFGVNPAGLLGNIMTSRVYMMISTMTEVQILHAGMWLYIGILAVYGVILYCITMRMLNHRLNLE